MTSLPFFQKWLASKNLDLGCVLISDLSTLGAGATTSRIQHEEVYATLHLQANMSGWQSVSCFACPYKTHGNEIDYICAWLVFAGPGRRLHGESSQGRVPHVLPEWHGAGGLGDADCADGADAACLYWGRRAELKPPRHPPARRRNGPPWLHGVLQATPRSAHGASISLFRTKPLSLIFLFTYHISVLRGSLASHVCSSIQKP